jgi:hypothetical protein
MASRQLDRATEQADGATEKGYMVGLERKPSSEMGAILVTFTLPAEAAAASACLVGDFTDWAPLEMERTDDGGHRAAVELAAGQAYRFRYLLDGARWENDWAADAYVANDFGGDDSVVDLRTPPTAGGAVEAPTKPVRSARKVTKKTGTNTATKPTEPSRRPGTRKAGPSGA